jgi:hypothetical protein
MLNRFLDLVYNAYAVAHVGPPPAPKASTKTVGHRGLKSRIAAENARKRAK